MRAGYESDPAVFLSRKRNMLTIAASPDPKQAAQPWISFNNCQTRNSHNDENRSESEPLTPFIQFHRANPYLMFVFPLLSFEALVMGGLAFPEA